MPKKKVIKNKKPLSFRNKIFKSIKAFYDTRTWTKIFLTLLALWGLVWCGQVAVERYRFYDAEKKLDKLASELQKELGDEYKFKKEKVCGYQSVKYGKGDRNCSIHISSENISSSNTKASEKAMIFKKVIENSRYFNVKALEKNQAPFKLGSSSKESSQSVSFNFYSGKPAISCGGAFVYSAEANLPSTPIGNGHSKTGFTCVGFAKLEYFPVKD